MDMEKAERFNLMTSLPGAVAAPPGVALLLAAAVRQNDPWKIASFSIYGVTLLILFLTTLIYHALQGRAKPLFQKLDHCAIYLLIAGTYTPFSLVTLRGGWGWTLFALVWGGAAFGIVQELWPGRLPLPRIPDLAVYLGMGWLILIAIRPLLHALSWQGTAWIGVGGFFYTGGIVFFALDKRFARAHGLWHLCVLAGGISHYLAVLYYVA
ncbi:MAG TPA: hemolysin III family protein [Geobacteraceae bacterium]|nr:hemolysin III family protein [Geobacteraceae bacterium]